ncbi:putative NADP-dependent oxido YfmJ [Cyphellophora attinorum]|uniref:Putative NADP-dependent oxido YfmJ n=1 Tax=Cyphellophora attinorum TaxID=1664694 RepID=A0A0N0NKB0_9EURO|nr:putative NADP-dependent oxido YfmJ [Phialophora attinorum]KPI37828.1 putative NADP-dependent oxido YfmJ [Phialophora attinorum]
MTTYQKVVLAKRPAANIIPGETFRLESAKAPTETDLKDGEVLFEARYLSLDPAMRGWLNDTRSYVPPVQIGETMRGYAVGVCKASKSKKFPAGSVASGITGWTELAVVNEKTLQKVVLPKNGWLTDTLSVLGTTGLTAYFGLLNVGQVKAGDFVVVSGAAGATGSVVGQIAKLKGATVLGIAGSDDKCTWLRELGFDDASTTNRLPSPPTSAREPSP